MGGAVGGLQMTAGCGPQVAEFRRQKVTVLGQPTAVDAGLDVRVDNVRGYASDLDESIVLNKYGVAGQIAVSDWRIRIVQITIHKSFMINH